MERLTQRNSEHNSWGNQYRHTFQHLFPENNLNIAWRNKLFDLYMPMYLQVCLKFSNRLSFFFMSFSIFFYFSFTTGFSLKKDALFWNSFLTIKLLRPRCLLSSFFFFKIYQYVIGSYVFVPPCLYFVLFINYLTFFFSSVYFLIVVTAWFITFSSHGRLWKTLTLAGVKFFNLIRHWFTESMEWNLVSNHTPDFKI